MKISNVRCTQSVLKCTLDKVSRLKAEDEILKNTQKSCTHLIVSLRTPTRERFRRCIVCGLNNPEWGYVITPHNDYISSSIEFDKYYFDYQNFLVEILRETPSISLSNVLDYFEYRSYSDNSKEENKIKKIK